MTEIVRCSFEGLRGIVLPGSAGLGDLPLTRIKSTPATAAAANFGARIAGYGRRTYSNEFDTWITFEDYMLIGDPQFWRARLEFRFSDTDGSLRNAVDPGDLPLTKYSMRYYFKPTSLSNIAMSPLVTLFSFLNGDGDASVANYKWTYALSGFNTSFPFNNHTISIRNGRNALDGGSAEATRFSDEGSALDAPFRVEVQVDGSRPGSTVFCRVYNPDQDICWPARSLRARPTSVAADRVYFGDNDNSTPVQAGPEMGPVEIHDDFDLGGQFHYDESATDTQLVSTSAVGSPVRRQFYEWFEWDAGGEALDDLEYLGVWDGDSIVDEKVTEMTYRDIVPPPYTAYHWFQLRQTPAESTALYYFSQLIDPEEGTEVGNQAFPLGLIYPSGDPPPGGWPLWTWFHGGFFIGGNFFQMPYPLINWLLSRGFAVATIEYRPSVVVFGNFPDYPEYPEAGIYPQWAVDGKNAINYLKARGSEASGGNGLYPINGNKVITSGHSAGGMIAQIIAFSRDLADDGFGNSFRTMDNGVWQTVPGAPDPEILATWSWAGPVDLQWAVENDPTHPDFGAPDNFNLSLDPNALALQAQNSTNGLLVSTGKAIMGLKLDAALPDLSHVSLAHLVDINTPLLPPSIAYARGTSDYLIPKAHPDILEAALDAAGYTGEYTYMEEPGVTHDGMEGMYNGLALDRWIATIPGL